MAAFEYTAINSQSKSHTGSMEADSERQVRVYLREEGLIPLTVDRVRADSSRSFLKGMRARRQRLSKKDLTLITRQMATLITAAIPIDEVLTSVAKQAEKPGVKSVLLGVRARLLEGHGLAEAMRYFPQAFPELYRTTVAAGEKAGRLDVVLEKLADYTDNQNKLRQRVMQALVYPILMTLVSLGVIVFLLVYVVPQIVGVFTQTHQVLPVATVVLIGISHFVASYGVIIIGMCVVAVILWARLMRSLNIRRQWHYFLLKLPLLGKNKRLINCARFGRTVGILLSATVPVLEAMQAGADLVSLIPMKEALVASIDKVREGMPVHTALKNTGYFPPMFVHLVGSGEGSGRLDEMLSKAAFALESDVEVLIQNTLTLFEPLLILAMGMIVLFIVLAIMLPIFDLDQFSG